MTTLDPNEPSEYLKAIMDLNPVFILGWHKLPDGSFVTDTFYEGHKEQLDAAWSDHS